MGLVIARAQQEPGLYIVGSFFALLDQQRQGLLHLALFQQFLGMAQHSGKAGAKSVAAYCVKAATPWMLLLPTESVIE
jgi:hypothetical protein